MEKLLSIPGVIDTTGEHGMTVQFQAADGTADVYGLDEDPVKDLMINRHYPRGVPRCSYSGGQVQPDAGSS